MAEDVGEVAIKSHECAAFGGCDSQEALVDCAGQLLVPRKGDIVTSSSKKFGDAIWDVFVELRGSHVQAVTGTMLSRARSAA